MALLTCLHHLAPRKRVSNRLLDHRVVWFKLLLDYRVVWFKLLLDYRVVWFKLLDYRVVWFKLLLDYRVCLLYTSPSPRDGLLSRMPSSA